MFPFSVFFTTEWLRRRRREDDETRQRELNARLAREQLAARDEETGARAANDRKTAYAARDLDGMEWVDKTDDRS